MFSKQQAQLIAFASLAVGAIFSNLWLIICGMYLLVAEEFTNHE